MPAPLPVLVTRRLTMRPPLEVDLEAVAAAIGDIAVSRWLGTVPHPYTLDDARHWFERMERGPDDRRFVLHDARGLAGVVSLRVHPEPSEAEIALGEGGVPELGYWLARDRWGRGLMSEAVRAVLADHFARGGGDVVSGAQVDNAASLAIQRKMGFATTGKARRACMARGGEVTIERTRLTCEAFERHRSRARTAA